MSNFAGIPLNFLVFFSNFSCFHQYSRKMKLDFFLYIGQHAVSLHLFKTRIGTLGHLASRI